MKTRKKIMFTSAIMLIGITSAAHANTRLNQVMWTDRGIANPPLSENTSTIDQSIEHFWNLPIPDPSISTRTTQSECRPTHTPTYRSSPCREPYRYAQPMEKRTHTTVTKQPNHSISQRKDQRDRRGYFGINLFNMIPLIDIVTGSSETTSSDHVEASR
jgi:hypothetical protein